MTRYLLAGLLALGLITPAAHAQTAPLLTGYQRPLPVVPLDSVTHQITYRGVLPAAGLPQAEVYGRAQEWLARQFEQYDQVVRFADTGRGVLIGQAMVQAVGPAQKNLEARRFNLLFRFRLRAQPDGLHYELTDISYPNYPVTTAASDAGGGLTADGLVQWQRADEFSRISTTAAQNRRQPVEFALRDYDQYTTKGEPKPRMVQQCQGIQEAMTTLVAALGRELSQPLP
ncbi:DUF4468 domain-containing protein [Hymenobacter perfusus]|uniref:DUF4468 domain-containing protein n=1 Tax=Hymenobacter perfusus TaxID=1236770 RepID=A0A428K908_9BACT|nr:DUF4468 domain-containing protein [Hymenobacter perfusus]RSK42728.1 DUF4468 domain-containing protein [Hymenobacter perfusus]